jgi:hypothetical protein
MESALPLYWSCVFSSSPNTTAAMALKAPTIKRMLIAERNSWFFLLKVNTSSTSAITNNPMGK